MKCIIRQVIQFITSKVRASNTSASKMTLTKISITVTLALLVFSCSSAPSQQPPPQQQQQPDHQLEQDQVFKEMPDELSIAINAFKDDDRLKPFFDEAVAYAVYPAMIRASGGFGGAWGSGWLVNKKQALIPLSTWQISAGLSLGLQSYRQIIFFRTEKTLADFMKGSLEFASQANIALISWGANGTPSFSSQAALFTQLRSGLLFEASVGVQGFNPPKLPLKNNH